MRPSLETNIKYLTFCFVDVETTGFSPKSDRICEIALAWWTLRDKAPREVVSYLIDPGKPPHPRAALAHGLTLDRLDGCHKFEEVADYLLQEWLGHEVIMVAHNAQFDKSFLYSELRRAGRTVPAQHWLCTYRYAKRNNSFKSNKLEALTQEVLHVKNPQMHFALQDVLYLARLFNVFVRSEMLDGTKTLGELIELQGGPIL